MTTQSQLSDLGIGRLFWSVRDAVIVADAATQRIFAVNPAAEDMFGYERGELDGQLIEVLVPEALKDAHRTGIARYAQQRHGPLVDAGQAVQLHAIRKDGSEIDVDLSLGSVDETEGAWVIGVLRDVTARVAAERQLAAQLDEQLRLNRTLDDFAARAAHDLRTVLVAVAGNYEPAVDDARAGRDPDAALDLARGSVTSGHALIDDLLRLARASGTPRLERVALPALLSELTRYVSGVIVEHVGVPDSVVADPTVLRQIFVNLLDNAARHGSTGRTASVVIDASESDEGWVLRVADRGPGVPPDDVDGVFSPFRRGRGAGDAKGAGLGLAIVAAGARAHGGRAWYEPRDGGGARFCVALPYAEPDASV